MAKAFVIIGSVAVVFLMLVLTIAGNKLNTATKQDSGCSLDTKIDFLRINDEMQACYSGNDIYFAVENTGSDVISGLSVYLESDYNVTMLVKGSIEPGSAKQQSLSLGTQSISGARELVLYPVVGSRNACMDAGVKVELTECRSRI